MKTFDRSFALFSNRVFQKLTGAFLKMVDKLRIGVLRYFVECYHCRIYDELSFCFQQKKVKGPMMRETLPNVIRDT